MYGDINFAPYYMHSALRDKMPNVSSLICIQPLKKRVGFKEIRTNLRGEKKLGCTKSCFSRSL